MSNSTASTAQPALIFIPDISGFTRFVTDVEIDHSSHIIRELLETLIESNEIGLEISEIEGDAILFYRFGPAPTSVELIAQIQRMFVNFHRHLRKYETHRICQCGACKTAERLTIKFIAHYGEIAVTQVKNFSQLFGKDVIVAHRLMKNNIEHHEYALITSNLVRSCENWEDVATVAWAQIQEGEDEYDSGKVNYYYFPLAPLMSRVPAPEVEDFSIQGVKVPVMHHSSVIIEAPLEMVFCIVADLPWRVKWAENAMEKAENLNTALFQNGATHRCLADGPIMVTHNAKISRDLITFTETNSKREFCSVYTLRRIGGSQTSLDCHCFMRKNFIRNLGFRLLYKRKVDEVYRKTWKNLNDYCKNLITTGKDHQFRIVLDDV
jgi:hypothetical protein